MRAIARCRPIQAQRTPRHAVFFDLRLCYRRAGRRLPYHLRCNSHGPPSRLARLPCSVKQIMPANVRPSVCRESASSRVTDSLPLVGAYGPAAPIAGFRVGCLIPVVPERGRSLSVRLSGNAHDARHSVTVLAIHCQAAGDRVVRLAFGRRQHNPTPQGNLPRRAERRYPLL